MATLTNLQPVTEGPARFWTYMTTGTLATAKADLETTHVVEFSRVAEVGDLVLMTGTDGASMGSVDAVTEGTSVTMTHSDFTFS